MQFLPKNIIKIELFGAELNLSERTAQDVLKLGDFARKSDKGGYDAVLQSAQMIADALKINLIEFENNPPKFFQFARRKEFKKLKKLIHLENILKLSIQQINDLSLKVLQLEGIDVNELKKKMEPITANQREKLAVTLQDA